jgi:predicted amino acid-binding ACT domain protein
MRTGKWLFFMIVVFIFNSMFIGVAPGAQVPNVEQRLIEEILTLDARVLALKNKVEQLSVQNNELRRELEIKQKELSVLNSSFNKRQNELSRWIVFSYKGGVGRCRRYGGIFSTFRQHHVLYGIL